MAVTKQDRDLINTLKAQTEQLGAARVLRVICDSLADNPTLATACALRLLQPYVNDYGMQIHDGISTPGKASGNDSLYIHPYYRYAAGATNVCFCRFQQNLYLLLVRKRGSQVWDLPEGFADGGPLATTLSLSDGQPWDADLLACAKRELQEETGLAFTGHEVLLKNICQYRAPQKMHMITNVYAMFYGQMSPHDSWHSLTSLPTLHPTDNEIESAIWAPVADLGSHYKGKMIGVQALTFIHLGMQAVLDAHIRRLTQGRCETLSSLQRWCQPRQKLNNNQPYSSSQPLSLIGRDGSRYYQQAVDLANKLMQEKVSFSFSQQTCE